MECHFPSENWQYYQLAVFMEETGVMQMEVLTGECIVMEFESMHDKHS